MVRRHGNSYHAASYHESRKATGLLSDLCDRLVMEEHPQTDINSERVGQPQLFDETFIAIRCVDDVPHSGVGLRHHPPTSRKGVEKWGTRCISTAHCPGFAAFMPIMTASCIWR